ncbi:DUF6262 family protein, partial [Streptomyces sp. TRM68367]|uniref:DUF6262 family protein n=1 Tax=Streptomyces sp. TRM68367 TaxID=2758415 RepID=UPI0019BCEF7E
MNSPAPQTEAANEARRQTTEAMLERIQTALRHMRRDRTPITKAAVARQADVSRSFIYQNDRARALIANAAQSTARPHEFTAPGASVTASHFMEEGCFRPAMI